MFFLLLLHVVWCDGVMRCVFCFLFFVERTYGLRNDRGSGGGVPERSFLVSRLMLGLFFGACLACGGVCVFFLCCFVRF